MANHWYNNYSQIKAFGKILYKADVLKTQDDIFEYFDKPSIYNEAYELWESLGLPEPSDKEWKEFKDNIEVEVVGDEEEDE